jgi:cytochrome c-type biogenesis protein CcmH
MRAKKTMLLPVMLTLLLATQISEATVALTVEDISKLLMCQCGCGMTLNSCYCDTANEMKSQIEQKISQGKRKDQIIADFKAIYGDQVLVTPPKSGLELTLWMLPIIASIAGTVIIYQFARKKAPISTSEIKPPILDIDLKKPKDEEMEEMARYEEIFYEEYKKFKEGKK